MPNIGVGKIAINFICDKLVGLGTRIATIHSQQIIIFPSPQIIYIEDFNLKCRQYTVWVRSLFLVICSLFQLKYNTILYACR